MKNNIQLNLLLQTPLRVNSTRLYDIRTRLLRDESKAVEQQGVEQEEKGKVMREEGREGNEQASPHSPNSTARFFAAS